MKSFQELYDKNCWGNNCKDVKVYDKMTYDTRYYMRTIQDVIEKYNIKNILDIGCGNWELMKFNNKYYEDNNIKYLGTDIVDNNIIRNNLLYKNEVVEFKSLGFIQADFDLVIIKDVIQHYDTEEAIEMIKKLIDNNKYVLCINGYKFSRDRTKNGWDKRVLDKKYRYHPISAENELKEFNEYELFRKHHRVKEYILYSKL